MDGIRLSTEGMISMEQKQAVIANNLANIGTAGYRKEVMDIQSFSQILERQIGGSNQMGFEGGGGNLIQAAGGMDVRGMLLTSTNTSYAQGALKMTGSSFDIALDDNGKGFFTVQGKDGIRFTRNGSFRLDTQGFLVTQDGSRVLGMKGPIHLGGKSFTVNDTGVILIDDKEVDRFLITEFPDKGTLRKEGENNFVAENGFKISSEFRTKQGYLEMSNVNSVQEMVDMMQTQKAFEANQKVLQAEDQALRKSVNEVGKISG